MPKRKDRQLNPEPFVPDGNESVKSKNRSKAPKHHQKGEKLISSNISAKIMKEAMLQQKEIQEEADAAHGNANSSFYGVEEPPKVEEDDDLDEFTGFSETQSQFGGYEVSGFWIESFSFVYAFFLLYWLVAASVEYKSNFEI